MDPGGRHKRQNALVVMAVMENELRRRVKPGMSAENDRHPLYEAPQDVEMSHRP